MAETVTEPISIPPAVFQKQAGGTGKHNVDLDIMSGYTQKLTFEIFVFSYRNLLYGFILTHQNTLQLLNHIEIYSYLSQMVFCMHMQTRSQS